MEVYSIYKRGISHFTKWGPLYLIGLGVIFRLNQYMFNRSLWLDEAFLATSIVNGTCSDFFQPQEYSHIVPTIFLVLVKITINAFGNNDFIIRLLPFSAGIISLFLFYKVGKKYISHSASLIALLLFVISDRLIFYSSELKPYTTDVLAALILLYTIICNRWDRLDLRKTFLLTLSGVLAMWLSHPAVFILAGLGAYLSAMKVKAKEWKQLGKLTIIFASWGFSFFIIYILYIKNYNNEWVLQWWKMLNSFMPFPPSLATVKWLGIKLFEIFKNPAGFQKPLPVTFVVGLLFIGGCVSLFKTDKVKLLILIFPIIFTIAASAFEYYPVHGRMILFFLPSIYLLIAAGITSLPLKNKSLKNLAIILLLVFVCSHPLYKAISHLKHPRVVEEIKPVLKYVKANMRKDDVVYVFYWSEPAFRYYAQLYGFDYTKCALISIEPAKEYVKEVDYFRSSSKNAPARLNGYNPDVECVIGISEKFRDCKSDIDQLWGNKRVWFIFSHSHEKPFLKYLDKIGSRIAENRQPGAAVYLYDLETAGDTASLIETD